MKVSSVSLEGKVVFPFINSKWSEPNLYTRTSLFMQINMYEKKV